LLLCGSVGQAVNVDELIRELQSKLDELSRVVAELRAVVERYAGGPEAPPSWMIPRIFVWYEIYLEGGIVDKDKFHEIGRKYGYKTRGLGGFFTGSRPSLRYVGVKRDRVMLEEWAAKEVEKYREWIEKNIEHYRRQ